jgi:hypothetical protein
VDAQIARLPGGKVRHLLASLGVSFSVVSSPTRDKDDGVVGRFRRWQELVGCHRKGSCRIGSLISIQCILRYEAFERDVGFEHLVVYLYIYLQERSDCLADRGFESC